MIQATVAGSRNSKKITIKDVARTAGMSTQTVSRVINNRPNVAPQTRSHIQQVISDLGYAPNIIAKSLSSGKSGTLGVIGFGLEYFGSTSVLRGIEQKAHEAGFSIILSLLNEHEIDRIGGVLQELLSRQVEGVIWSIPGIGTGPKGLSRTLAQAGVPVVFLNQEQCEDRLVVAINDRLGGQLATEHLLEQGYRRIGIITGPDRWWEAQQRELGWQETLRAAGISNLEGLKAEGDWSARSGELGLYRLLEQAPDLDAVFVSNDQMALGALQAARRRGQRVPLDLGVVGFDDLPEAAYFFPTLTTVRQDARKLGAIAVEKLSRQLRGEKDEAAVRPETTWVEPCLVVRESSVRK